MQGERESNKLQIGLLCRILGLIPTYHVVLKYVYM
jgi:hypothetical protein